MSAELDRFTDSISAAKTSETAWRALQDLAQATIGSRLFTVMTVDMEAGLARRAFTSHPQAYPVSGTKPIHRDSWFDIVHGTRQSFVANTIEDIAKVFPDHELIASLGCGSVLNLPVVIGDDLAATINMLDVPGHFTPSRVAETEALLTVPSRLCCALARLFDLGAEKPD